MRVPLMVSRALASYGLGGELAGVRRDREAEARGVARQAQQAGRVVEEAALVQHRELAGLEVVERVRCSDELAGA